MSTCSVNISGVALGGCGSWPCNYTGGGAGGTATCCVATYTGCTGSNSYGCGSYPSCTSHFCCGSGVYSGCGGSNSSPCTAGDCSATCCDREENTCNGAGPDFPTHGCAGTYGTQGPCEGDACCWWNAAIPSCANRSCGGANPVAPPNCQHCGCVVATWTCVGKKSCSSLSEGNCPTCGCTKQGYCPTVSCSSLSQGNCPSCTGCSTSGTCTPRTCVAVAALDNNPDVCAGCNTCGGDWSITDDRGQTPWAMTVTGNTNVAAGGNLEISTYQFKTASWGGTVGGGGTIKFNIGSGGSIAEP